MEPILGPKLSSESFDHSITETVDMLRANEERIKNAFKRRVILKFGVDPETARILSVLYADQGPASQAERLACLMSEALDRIGWKFYIHPTEWQTLAAGNVFKFHIGRRVAYDGH